MILKLKIDLKINNKVLTLDLKVNNNKLMKFYKVWTILISFSNQKEFNHIKKKKNFYYKKIKMQIKN